MIRAMVRHSEATALFVALTLCLAGSSAAQGAGSGTSESFALYLAAGFELPPVAAGAGSAASAAISLYLSPAFAMPTVAAGAGAGTSAAISVYLGSGFELPAVAGYGTAQSASFSAALVPIIETFATSRQFALDTRAILVDPMLTPPVLSASLTDCGHTVKFDWQVSGLQVDGFWLEWTDGSSMFARLRAFHPDELTFSFQPADGLEHVYRLCSVRGDYVSEYSQHVPARTTTHVGLPLAPAGMTVKSIGDNRTVRLHIRPPGDALGWAAIQTVRVEVSPAASFDSPLALDFPLSSPPDGELSFDYDRTGGAALYYRAVNIDLCGRESSPSPVAWCQAQYAPIIFVHGICGGPGDWGALWDDALQAHGYPASQYDRFSFSPSGHSWVEYAPELMKLIHRHLGSSGDWSNSETVDLVTYSQGGLAARAVIEQWGWGRFVRRLFMLATPNHGGQGSTMGTIVGTFWGGAQCDEVDYGDVDLVTNSANLRDLNFGSSLPKKTHDDITSMTVPVEISKQRRGIVQYYTLAGTGPSVNGCLRDVITVDPRCLWQLATDNPSTTAGDGVVPRSSVWLRDLETSHQWRDVDVRSLTTGLVHIPPMAVPGKSVAIQQSDEVAEFVVCTLQDQIPSGWALASATAVSRVPELDPAGGGGGPPPILLSSEHVQLSVGTAFAETSLVGGGTRVVFMLNAPRATLEVTSPDGRHWDLTSPEYASDPLEGWASLAIDQPIAGRWTIALASDSSQRVRFDALEESVAGGLNAELSQAVSGCTDVPVVTASWSGVDRVISATATLRSSSWHQSVTLHDDGLAPDGTASDGILAAALPSGPGDGAYEVVVAARVAQAGGGELQQARILPLEVSEGATVALDSTCITWGPNVLVVGSPGAIRINLHNTGCAATEGGLLRVVDQTTGDTLLVQEMALASGEGEQQELVWTPALSGVHELVATLELAHADAGARLYQQASVRVPVAQGTLVLDAPSSASSVVFRLWPPRPNPARSRQIIRFALPRHGLVTLLVYDVMGRRVTKLLDGALPAGEHELEWPLRGDNGEPVPPGLYFLHLRAGPLSATRRVVVIR
jgi:hypothetical protein